MKKKVLIFSLAYYPKHVGGAEVSIREITDRIPRDEIEFHMITNRFDSALSKVEQVGNVQVHRLGFTRTGADISKTHSFLFYVQKVLFVVQAFFKARSLHKKYEFDCMWGMMTYMLFPIALLRLTGVRVPYVINLQDGDPFERVFKRWYIRPVAPLLLYGFRNATAVQTLSTFLAEWARQLGFTGKVAVIPNAVDFELFSTPVNAEVIRRTREEIGKQDGETWLIHTGRFVHKNGLDTVVEALSGLPSPVHAFFIGDGPDRKKVEVLAKKLGVSDRLHIHPYVDLREMPRFLHACDIFIRPSRSEGMGASFVEAMAAGLPVIASQEGGLSDFLFDSVRDTEKSPTGFAVDANTPGDIVTAVERILDDHESTQKVVKNAQNMAKEKYDWELIASRMRREVFTELFNRASV